MDQSTVERPSRYPTQHSLPVPLSNQRNSNQWHRLFKTFTKSATAEEEKGRKLRGNRQVNEGVGLHTSRSRKNRLLACWRQLMKGSWQCIGLTRNWLWKCEFYCSEKGLSEGTPLYKETLGYINYTSYKGSLLNWDFQVSILRLYLFFFECLCVFAALSLCFLFPCYLVAPVIATSLMHSRLYVCISR